MAGQTPAWQTMTEQDEQRLTRYVLNDLPADERELVENRYFIDDEYHEWLLALESELVRDWVAGELPPDRARQFGARLQSDAQLRERVAMVEALTGRSRRDATTAPIAPVAVPVAPVWASSNWAQAAFLGAGLSLVLTSALGLSLYRASARLDRLQARLETATLTSGERNEGLSDPHFSPRAGVVRGTGTVSPLFVPARAHLVRLQLEIPGNSKPVRLVLHAVDSASEVWSAMQNNTGQVEISVPAGLLNRGDYELKAFTQSGDELESWAFRVAR